MPSATNLITLRQLLAEQFPQSRLGIPAAPVSPALLPTGTPALDNTLGGGLARGALTELVGAGPGSGSCLVLHTLLRQAAGTGDFLALIDGADSFDAPAVPPEVLAHLLWARCRTVDEALGAADILLRDPNFPLIVIDLKLNPATQLRKATATVWHRFARLLEQNDAAVLVITPRPLVQGARHRVRCESRLGLETLRGTPAETALALRFSLERATGGRDAAAQAG